jgi:hypothetical protein
MASTANRQAWVAQRLSVVSGAAVLGCKELINDCKTMLIKPMKNSLPAHRQKTLWQCCRCQQALPCRVTRRDQLDN